MFFLLPRGMSDRLKPSPPPSPLTSDLICRVPPFSPLLKLASEWRKGCTPSLCSCAHATLLKIFLLKKETPLSWYMPVFLLFLLSLPAILGGRAVIMLGRPSLPSFLSFLFSEGDERGRIP